MYTDKRLVEVVNTSSSMGTWRRAWKQYFKVWVVSWQEAGRSEVIMGSCKDAHIQGMNRDMEIVDMEHMSWAKSY